MKFKNFIKGINALNQAFPNRKYNNEILFSFLNDLSDDQFMIGINKIIKSHKELYPGTNIIALIRDNCIENKELTAGEAWGEVIKKIFSNGYYSKPTFLSEIIAKTVDCIGWQNICMSENIMVERAHFLKIYDQILEINRKCNLCLTYDNDFKKLEANYE